MDKIREAFERHQADLTGTDYEELKAHFDSNEQYVGSRYNEGSLYERDWLVWEACWKSRQAEVGEKDKRIEMCKALFMNYYNGGSDTDDLLDDLEKALRGDDDINVTR